MKQLCCWLIAIATLATPVQGREFCGLNILAVNESGEPVPNATVVLLQTRVAKERGATEEPRLLSTDDRGSIVVTDLPPGRYRVAVLADGTSWSSHGFSLDVGRIGTIKATLLPPPTRSPVIFERPTSIDLRAHTDVLEAMGERPLCVSSSEGGTRESYRFLWLRTFHRPVLVYLAFDLHGRAAATYKELSGAGGYDIGSLSETTTTDVSETLGKEFTAELAGAILAQLKEDAVEQFWSVPYEIDDGRIGVDGAIWMVEGRKEGRCHVVTRWSPDESDPFRRFAWTILGFVERRFYFDEVY